MPVFSSASENKLASSAKSSAKSTEKTEKTPARSATSNAEGTSRGGQEKSIISLIYTGVYFLWTLIGPTAAIFRAFSPYIVSYDTYMQVAMFGAGICSLSRLCAGSRTGMFKSWAFRFNLVALVMAISCIGIFAAVYEDYYSYILENDITLKYNSPDWQIIMRMDCAEKVKEAIQDDAITDREIQLDLYLKCGSRIPAIGGVIANVLNFFFTLGFFFIFLLC